MNRLQHNNKLSLCFKNIAAPKCELPIRLTFLRVLHWQHPDKDMGKYCKQPALQMPRCTLPVYYCHSTVATEVHYCLNYSYHCCHCQHITVQPALLVLPLASIMTQRAQTAPNWNHWSDSHIQNLIFDRFHREDVGRSTSVTCSH